MNTTDKLLKFYNLKALHSKFSLFIAVNWSMVDFISNFEKKMKLRTFLVVKENDFLFGFYKFLFVKFCL